MFEMYNMNLMNLSSNYMLPVTLHMYDTCSILVCSVMHCKRTTS